MTVRTSLLTLGFLCICLFTAALAQEKAASLRHVTLHDAIQLALQHNHLVRISTLRVEEKKQAKAVAKSRYLPTIENESRFFHVTDTQFIQLPQGALGIVSGTPIPGGPVTINQGGRTFETSGTTLVQPLTQLFTKIKPGNQIASADLNTSRANARDAENRISLKVHQIYYRLLIAQLHRSATEVKIKAAQDLESERVQQVKYGSLLEEELIASQAQALQAKQELLTTELQLSDLTLQLNDAIGLALSTELELDPNVPAVQDTCPREECVKTALESHPEVSASREEVRKASAAVQLSKGEYVPDVGAFARYSYQNNIPFLARNFGTFGVQLNYELFDGGRRQASLKERNAQLAQAKENLARVTEEVELAVQVAYNKLQRTREMVSVSQKLLALRSESSRVSSQQLQSGVTLRSQVYTAAAQELDAKAQLLQSQLDYVEASDELTQAMGITPQ